MLEFLFNKVADLQACKFIKKRLQLMCSLVNISKYLRTRVVREIILLVAVEDMNSKEIFSSQIIIRNILRLEL